jgi:sugar phosphate isomerase/epimerase
VKLRIINSAFNQAGADTATGLRHMARIGFDGVDIFTGAMNIPLEEKRSIARICEKESLPIVALPVVATGLIDFDERVCTFHVTRCKQFINLAADFGAAWIVLVLGEYSWQSEVIPPADQWRGAVKTCRILGDYAGEKNIQLAMELEPFRLRLLNNV